jgi:hypothetical protein
MTEHPATLVEAVAKALWDWDLEDKPEAPAWDEAVHEDRETMRDGAIAILDTIRTHAEAEVVLSYCENHPETAMPITGIVHSCPACSYTETHPVDGEGAIHADR